MERRRSICGPGGEIAYFHDPEKTPEEDRRNPDKHCNPGMWIMHEVGSIVPVAVLPNMYTCQMIEYVDGGKYTWTKLPASLI